MGYNEGATLYTTWATCITTTRLCRMYVKYSPLNSRSGKGPLTCSPRIRLYARLAVVPAMNRKEATAGGKKEKTPTSLPFFFFYLMQLLLLLCFFFLPFLFPNEKGGVFPKFSSVFFLTCCIAELSTSAERNR